MVCNTRLDCSAGSKIKALKARGACPMLNAQHQVPDGQRQEVQAGFSGETAHDSSFLELVRQ